MDNKFDLIFKNLESEYSENNFYFLKDNFFIRITYHK